MDLTHNVVSLALAAIDLAKWGSKASIVELVRRETLGNADVPTTGYVEISRVTFAWNCGLDDRWTHHIVDELVAERVLLRVGGRGARAHAYRLNPELGVWRVPWRGDRLDALTRIAFFSRAGIHDKPRKAARYSAQSRPFVARYSAQENGTNGAVYRATTDPRSARYSAQPGASGAARAPIPDLEELSLASERASEHAHGPLDELVIAIEERTGATVYPGSEPFRELQRIALEHPDTDELVGWIAAYPNDRNGPPLVVKDLSAHLARSRSTRVPAIAIAAPRPECERCEGSGWIADPDDLNTVYPCDHGMEG